MDGHLRQWLVPGQLSGPGSSTLQHDPSSYAFVYQVCPPGFNLPSPSTLICDHSLALWTGSHKVVSVLVTTLMLDFEQANCRSLPICKMSTSSFLPFPFSFSRVNICTDLLLHLPQP